VEEGAGVVIGGVVMVLGRIGDGDVDEFFFFSSRRRHTRFDCDWSSDVCSSDLARCIGRIGSTGIRRKKSANTEVKEETAMNWFKNLKISVKLISAFLILSGITGVVGYVGIENMVKLRSEERRVGKECRSRGWPY